MPRCRYRWAKEQGAVDSHLIAEAERLVVEWEPYSAVCGSLRCPLIARSELVRALPNTTALPPEPGIGTVKKKPAYMTVQQE